SIALRIEGPPDTTALDRCLTAIARRHEALRTTFASDGEMQFQLVQRPGPVTARRVDLTGCPTEEKDAEASRLIAEEGTRAFDLADGPIWSSTVLQLEPQIHLLLLIVHNIV